VVNINLGTIILQNFGNVKIAIIGIRQIYKSQNSIFIKMYCQNCKKECYQWETICSDCTHKSEMIKIERLEKSLSQMFARSGINYNEFKATIEDQTI
jgi:predicted amidophosphoribosyltransferase